MSKSDDHRGDHPLQPRTHAVLVTVASCAFALTIAAGGIELVRAGGVFGDCDGSGRVEVADLIKGVNILLGQADLSTCPAFDEDGSLSVSVSELVMGVNAVLGIGGTPTPTPALDGAEGVQGASRVLPQTVNAFHTLSFGPIARQDKASGARSAVSAVRRLAAAPRVAFLARRPDGRFGVGAEGPCEEDLCPDGGCATANCAPSGRRGTLTILYDGCVSTLDSGHRVTRTGEVSQEVVPHEAERENFCDSMTIGPLDEVTQRFTEFTHIEQDQGGSEVARVVIADLIDKIVPTRNGCEGPDGTEHIDGSIEQSCTAAAETVTCTAAVADLAVAADTLTIVRSSGGFPCEMSMETSGSLEIEDRVNDNERFSERLSRFLLTEVVRPVDQATLVSIPEDSGSIALNCLGELRFETVTARNDDNVIVSAPLEFPPVPTDGCPVAGAVDVLLPIGPPPAASLEATMQARSGAGVATGSGEATGSTSDTELFSKLYRSGDGTIYQVIQNRGAAASFFADAVRITSVTASRGGSVGQCANTAGARDIAQAVVGAAVSEVFDLSDVYKSVVIPDASEPCVNPSAGEGEHFLEGLVCIGPGCDANCECDDPSHCAAFTIGNAPKITKEATGPNTIPAAELVVLDGPKERPCSGFSAGEDPEEDRLAYRFGRSGPTTEKRQCDEGPVDGFSLPYAPSAFPGGTSGSTVIFAYDTPFFSLLNAGYAGFPVDTNNNSQLRCGTGARVLHLGLAKFDSIAAPRIRYMPGEVAFDYNGDGAFETPQPCVSDILAECREP